MEYTLEELNAGSLGTMAGNLGITYTLATPERVEATMPVDERTVQPFGLLSGGATMALAETLAGLGSMLCCREGQMAVGMQVSANHVSPAHKGDVVHGTATPLHLGRGSHVWNVDVHTSAGRLVSTIRVVNTVITSPKSSY